MKIKDKVKIIKVDEYIDSQCLGKIGYIEQIIEWDDGKKKIYDVQIAGLGLWAFLENEIVVVK